MVCEHASSAFDFLSLSLSCRSAGVGLRLRTSAAIPLETSTRRSLMPFKRSWLPRLAGTITWLLAMAVSASAQGLSYEHESKNVYDSAKSIELSAFEPSALRERFKGFASTQCAQRKLARLIVATNQRDL